MTTHVLDLQDGGTTYDLYDNTNYIVEPPGPDFPTPEKNEVWSGKNILRDGEEFIDKSYGNRAITIPLTVLGADMDTCLQNVRNLETALIKAERYSTSKWGSRVRLKHQPKEASNPIYFDILSGKLEPPKGITQGYLSYAMQGISFELTCKPFGYGDETYLVSGTAIWNHDDGDAGHDMYVDVTGVLGTAPAAARVYAKVDTVTQSSTKLRVARRSRGDLDTLIHVSEGEDWSADYGAVSGSATCSNAEFMDTGSRSDNQALTNFIGNDFALTQLQGTYRVYARLKSSAATDGTLVKLQFRVKSEGYTYIGDTKYIGSSQNGFWVMFDLGLFTIPHIEIPDDITTITSTCNLFAGADSGAGNWRVQVDYFLFMPADEKYAILGSSGGLASGKYYVLDATSLRSLAYLADSFTQITTIAVDHRGGLIELFPGVTNRLIFSNDSGASSDKLNLINDQYKIFVIAKPRYLTVR